MPYNASPEQLALVQKVEFRIDDVITDGQTPAVNREGIYEQMEHAARKLLRTVDREILLFAATDGTATANGAKVDNNGSLIIPMPADFLRFFRLKLSNWERTVDELQKSTSTLYKVQANPNSAVDAYRPFAVLIPYPSAAGKQALEAFPNDTSNVTEFSYVALKAPEDMPADLLDAMLWYTAGAVLEATDQSDRAPLAYAASERAISQLRVGMVGEEDR